MKCCTAKIIFQDNIYCQEWLRPRSFSDCYRFHKNTIELLDGSHVIIQQILLLRAKFLQPCARALCWSAPHQPFSWRWGEVFPEFRFCSVLKAVVSRSKSPLTCCVVEFEHASHVLLTVSRLKLVLKTTLMTGPCVVFGILVVGRVCGEVSQPVAS